MIQSLLVKNFQCHSNLILDLDHPVTTLLSATDTGKSAIIRALKWCILNEQPDKNFITWGKGYSKVKLTIDGKTITRKRTGNQNLYKLDGKLFHAFGHSIPNEIETFLNIGEVCFQSQHSLPFWFASSAGQVSKNLNQIVNLDLIDSSLMYVSSYVRKCNSTLQFVQDRLGQEEDKERHTRWIKETNKELGHLESLQRDIEKESESISILESILDKTNELLSTKRDGKEILIDGENTIQQLDSHDKEAAKLRWDIEELESIIQRIGTGETWKRECKKELEKAEEEFKELSKGKCPLCNRNFPVE